jgi:hypothetical protein
MKSPLLRRVEVLEATLKQRPAIDDAIPMWKTLLANRAPTPAEIEIVFATLDAMPALRARVRDLVDAGLLAQWSATDRARACAGAAGAR